jgi:POT family proton-dependent oligopeptide transporter
MTSDVAPPGYGSQLMGLYFLGAALGAGLGGQYSRLLETVPLPVYFGAIAVTGLLAGIVLAARARAYPRPGAYPPAGADGVVEPTSRPPQAAVARL